MKYCNNCKVEIGGSKNICPLCQNSVSGEDSPFNWPPMKKLKKQAFLYKLQLFLVLAGVAICLSLDFLMDVNSGRHWSIVISIPLVTIEIVVRGLLKKSPVIAKILTVSFLHVALILLLLSWYFGFMNLVIYTLIPILMAVSLTANLVFSLIDTTDNAMVYLLTNILAGVLVYIVLVVGRLNRSIPWTICLMISVVTLIGIIVFKGRKVWTEVQKRMNF